METTTEKKPFDYNAYFKRESDAEARRRAKEKATPFLFMLKDHRGHWIIEDRYATSAELEIAVEEHIQWEEDNEDYTPEAGVDFLAVQAHGL